ncbi:MAG: S41 family peptidase [Candidatus Delongbacteria bacterium]|nr:S41 family peptidase [Candidatus Delongbacteria bacterium]
MIRTFLRAFIILIASTGICRGQEKSADYYKELSDNIKLFFDVMLTLNENYVDTANIEEMMSEGIKAMLAATDPYTVLLKDAELEHFDELSTGTYGGIGIYLGTSGPDKTLTVISPMDDTPASKVGLRAGDRIVFINDVDTKGMSIRDASKHLRGERGTKVVLQIKRIGSDKILKFTLTRESINVKNIPYSEVTEEGVGYIKLTQFTATSYHDFVKEFEKLVSKGANSLIVDLRFNPGGLLDSAVKLCNAFLQRDNLVVFTRGRGTNIDSEYRTYMTPLDTEIPIVVLINGSSASASEIFAGSLQDHDRAVILGESSFGKGLVQQLFDVGNIDKRNLKMTVRKYYTASGRLIQKEDIFGDNAKNGTDTLYFETLINRRKVPSGLGIIPDIEIPSPKIPEYIMNLKMNNYFNDFIYHYYEKYPDHDHNGTIDDSIMEEFKNYLDGKDFIFKTFAETMADSILDFTNLNDYPDEVKEQIAKTILTLKEFGNTSYENNIEEIRRNLNMEFSVYKNGNEEKYRIANRNDNAVMKAVEILTDQKKYRNILGY